MVLPLLQTVLAVAAGPQRYGRVLALVSVPGQLAALLGPLLGGVLTDGPGWRWVFLGPPCSQLPPASSHRKQVLPGCEGQCYQP
jgi:MFS family permease